MSIGTTFAGAFADVVIHKHTNGVKVARKHYIRCKERKDQFKTELAFFKSCPAHENLVALQAYDEANCVLDLEFMDCDLYRYLLRVQKPCEPLLCVSYIHQMLLALEHLHSHGFVHGDLSNKNVLIDPDGHLKLCDFGGCWRPDDLKEEKFGSYTTITYRAPELVLKPTQRLLSYFSFPVDIWAAGCLLYEMITFKTLFDARDNDGQCKKHDDFDMKNLLQNYKGAYKKEFLSLFKQMLQIDPDDRASASELLKHSLFDVLKKCS